MGVVPLRAAAEQDAFGHSWGLANVTSSEVAGAAFDKVVSLSGAGMLPEWSPDPDTVYTDLSYRDILQTGQDLGVVWDGNNPRSHFTVLTENHNLIATDDPANNKVLRDLWKLVAQ